MLLGVMLMQPQSKRLKAFTLIEVLVAMLVLAIGLLGLAGITVVVLRSNTLSQQISEATNIAQDLIETLKQRSISNLPDCDAGNTLSAADVGDGSNCKIISESGLLSVPDYYPPKAEICAVSEVFDSTPRYFDIISANLTGGTDPNLTSGQTLCNLDSVTLPKGHYIRYFRSYVPGTDADTRAIVTVVLWKDKFGKWRHIKLATSKSE